MLPPLIENLLYVAVSATAVLFTGHHRFMRSRQTSVAVLVISIGFPVGQLLRSDHTLYPFVRWDMYSTPPSSTTFHRYMYLGPTGHPAEFDLVRLSFSSPRALIAKIDQLLFACQCQSQDPALDDLLQSLSRLHFDLTSEHIAEWRITEHSLTSNSITLRYTFRPR